MWRETINENKLFGKFGLSKNNLRVWATIFFYHPILSQKYGAEGLMEYLIMDKR